MTRLQMIFLFTDSSAVLLYRYEDPVLGPRTMPTLVDILKGKVLVPSNGVFNVNVTTETITIKIGKEIHQIGNEILYFINENMC